MKYNLTSISCNISEDIYDNGMSANSFHSYRFPITVIANNKEKFLEIISNYVGKVITEDDLDIIDNCVNVSTLVSYKPSQDWDEFPLASDNEKELWKEGKLKLYVADYTFICYNLADEFQLN